MYYRVLLYVSTTPERDYDLAKAQVKIYGDGLRRLPEPQVPPEVASADERARWQFPALAWLESLIDRGKWQRVLLVLPPVHVMAQPTPGSRKAIEEAECKSRIAAFAAPRSIPVLDFRIASDITRHDENYWDPLHYRVAIAERFARGAATALKTRADDPNGDWRVLKAPR